jgi:hypothetical protein
MSLRDTSIDCSCMGLHQRVWRLHFCSESKEEAGRRGRGGRHCGNKVWPPSLYGRRLLALIVEHQLTYMDYSIVSS